MRPYIELTKPRITWLILMSTGIGYFFGMSSHRLADLNVLLLLHTIIGTALIASGTAALNQWYERDADEKMRRTADRPLPSGRLDATRALWFAIALSVVGFFELYFGANPLTAWIGAFTLASYLFLYTPLKRRTWWSTTIGAIPGAMPPMIGYAAAAGTITMESWVLFAILFLWQFPHFHSIAWLYREDYEEAGVRMLPVVESDGRSTAFAIVFYALALVPVTLVPTLIGMSGWIYFAAALLLGAGLLWFSIRMWTMKLAPVAPKSKLRARHLLQATVIYLTLLFALMMINRAA